MSEAYSQIRAPRGGTRTAKGWIQEAAKRMLMNNLDPEVAEKPEELIVYGGRGKAARNWECYHKIVETLERLGNEQTLLVQSGKAVGSSQHSPTGTQSSDSELQSGSALGDLGGVRQAGCCGTDDVRSDDRRFLDLYRNPGDFAGYIRDISRCGEEVF